MGLECTSCSLHISPTSRMYKCLQCTNHVICTSCFHKIHNRASTPFHTMLKIDPVVHLVVPKSYAVVEPKRKVMSYDLPTTSTIFTSRDYLTQFLGYCNHCLKVIVGNKDEIYTCNQCTNDTFNVCKQCMPSMTKYHTPTHTFSKKITNSELVQLASNLNHLNTKCNSCLQKNFKGIRYHTKSSDLPGDVCQHCVEKTYKQQPIKIIPHPFLLATNKYSLAKRAIKVIDQYSHPSDPLTGWTRSDAETIIEKSLREQTSYRKYLSEILAKREALTNHETDLDWKTAKFGLDLMSHMGDSRVIY
ncbi:hypothetical protein I4U23_024882 [Adineta vaga]|nr:hypothetical protein I4U23_024882 [Adineta vaga]